MSFLETPKDPQAAITLNRSLHRTDQTIVLWVRDQLNALDRDNRTDTDEKTFRPRQGAAQVLAQLLDMIHNAKEEVATLEMAISNKQRGKNVF